MKETKIKYLQDFMWEDPFILSKSRGVVGVPTNGDMLGEAVISACLPKGYRYRKTKSRFSQNINFSHHMTFSHH